MTDTPLIIADQLVKRYGYQAILRQLSLQIQRGEFVALLGVNGGGKSTFLRLLAGLTRPTSGTLTVGGWAIPDEIAAVRGQIGMVGHQPMLYGTLTARENLAFFARLYPITDAAARIQARIEQVGLKRHADQPTRTFSRGMQQRLSIARALLHDPALLLFDEPYTGLDQDAAALLDALLLEAHAEGRTILMTTHELDRAARLAQRIIILQRGVVGYDSPAVGLDGLTLAAHYREVTGLAVARE
ncbi:MAG: heme ABC exporter ATP-binding protein CcmA [Phototrophicaceae bacterium]